MPVLIELPNKEEFIDLYMKGTSETRLAFRYYVSRNTIYRWVNKFGISRRSKNVCRQDLEGLLKQKLTYKQIGKQLNCSAQTVRYYLVKYCLAEAKPGINKNRKKLIDKDEMYRLRVDKRWTYEQLARHFQVSKGTIQKRCKEYNIPIVTPSNTNHIWRRLSHERI